MSYKEKENIVTLVTGLGLSVPYFTYIVLKYTSDNVEDLSQWAKAILVIIPIRVIGMVLGIIIMMIISAAITQKEPSTETDERDDLIELKGLRNSHYIFAFGMGASILAVALGQSAVVMMIGLIIAGIVSELFETGSKIFYYRNG